MCFQRDPRHDGSFAFSLVLDIVNPPPSHFPAGLEELGGTGVLISWGLVVSLLPLLSRHSHAEGHRLSSSKHGLSHYPHVWQDRHCSSWDGAGFLQLSERMGRAGGVLGDIHGDQSWDCQWPSSGRHLLGADTALVGADRAPGLAGRGWGIMGGEGSVG